MVKLEFAIRSTVHLVLVIIYIYIFILYTVYMYTYLVSK